MTKMQERGSDKQARNAAEGQAKDVVAERLVGEPTTVTIDCFSHGRHDPTRQLRGSRTGAKLVLRSSGVS